jgi:ribosomal protein S18 acetylase RimI-like enzyme
MASNVNALPLFSIGIALEDGKVIGAVVLTVEDEPDAALSYWEVTRRAGCIPTLLTMCYDQVLEEPLEPHECLIDFLAVSSEARGKGVGGALMKWAENTAAEILSRRVPEAVKDHGVLMSLWVAADNTPATRLYEKQGYKVIKKTNEAIFACLSSHIFRQFLGHPVWWKMARPLAVSAEEIALHTEASSAQKKVINASAAMKQQTLTVDLVATAAPTQQQATAK